MKRKESVLDEKTYKALRNARLALFDVNGELWLIYDRLKRDSSAKKAKDLKWGSTKVQDIIDAGGFCMRQELEDGSIEYEVNSGFLYVEAVLLEFKNV